MKDQCNPNPSTDGQTRVKILQAAWPTGDVIPESTFDHKARYQEIARKLLSSKRFLISAILLTLGMIPTLYSIHQFMTQFGTFLSEAVSYAIFVVVLIPAIFTLVGIWWSYSLARKETSDMLKGVNMLLISQYINAAVSTFAASCLILGTVHGCSVIGTANKAIQDPLFWISFAVILLIVLAGYLYWKVVFALRIIRDTYEGTLTDGYISAAPGVFCIILGSFTVLSMTGVFQGTAMMLLGSLMLAYRRDYANYEAQMQLHAPVQAERQVLTPTWKQI